LQVKVHAITSGQGQIEQAPVHSRVGLRPPRPQALAICAETPSKDLWQRYLACAAFPRAKSCDEPSFDADSRRR
jgi:hypothetical protein